MQCWCYKVLSSLCQPSLPGEWLVGSGSISISDLLADLFLTLLASSSPCESMTHILQGAAGLLVTKWDGYKDLKGYERYKPNKSHFFFS